MTAPMPPSDVEQLVAWLREHRGSWTDDALHDRLVAAGHDPAHVDAAFEALRREAVAGTGRPLRPAASSLSPVPAQPPRRPWDPLIGFLATVGAVVGIPLLIVQLGAGNLAVGVGLAAILGAMVSWGVTRDSDRRGIASGIGAAIVVVVVLPVVAVVGLFGYCLVAGGLG